MYNIQYVRPNTNIGIHRSWNAVQTLSSSYPHVYPQPLQRQASFIVSDHKDSALTERKEDIVTTTKSATTTTTMVGSLPIPLPMPLDVKLTPPTKYLSDAMIARFVVYAESTDFGKWMKPGKNPDRWGPPRWDAYCCICFMMMMYTSISQQSSSSHDSLTMSSQSLTQPFTRSRPPPPQLAYTSSPTSTPLLTTTTITRSSPLLSSSSGSVSSLDANYYSPEVSVHGIRRWLENQPFVLPCGKCRQSFAQALSKRPLDVYLQKIDDLSVILNYSHNKVNRRFNKDPRNEALPRKHIFNIDEHRNRFRKFLDSSDTSHPPDIWVKRIFEALYYESDHYPDDYLDKPEIVLRRLQYQVDFALWAGVILPAGTHLHHVFYRYFGLGSKFDSHVNSDGSTMKSVQDHVRVLLSSPSTPKHQTQCWLSSRNLTATLHHVENIIRGTRHDFMNLSDRIKYVQLSVTVPSIPVTIV